MLAAIRLAVRLTVNKAIHAVSLVTTNQSGSNVGQNQIGGDQNNIGAVYIGGAFQSALLLQLEKLKLQVDKDEQCTETNVRLKRFYNQRNYDKIVGLIDKLKAGAREDEIEDAIEKKEIFAKILERYSHFSSAQEIFACLLSRAEYYFNQFLRPQLGSISLLDYNVILDEKVIQPTVADCCASILEIDHTVAMGMIYWLAERCFIRWHK